ncbi:large ribosomal subunit protein uL10m [Halyomorpha halys]|uniref:large ribosomal subunit protein uL10m n=1 Tax=Halyomorpha halys TaxID=286706 RepID=UPI0006D4C888|nr:39S ribosomal protein L10, mitochondrial [Halyomorpha halys]
MANFIFKEGLLGVKWIPRFESVRFRRVNVQRPRPPHYLRAKYEALVKPIYKEDTSYLPPTVKCMKNQELEKNTIDIINPLERIIAKELYQKLESSKFVGFLHVNPICGEDEFQARVLLFRERVSIDKFSKKVVDKAVRGTIYESILPLFITHTAIIFSEELHVDKILKVLRKIPQYVLMAGIVDNRLLNVSQLKTYAELKNITTARAGLVSLLNSFGQQIVNNITAHPRNLATQLQLYSESKSESS